MAVTWDWKCKIGEVITRSADGEKTYSHNMYAGGNCPFVILYEYKEKGEDMYTMYMFACNEDHMKNELGLSKDYKDNLFDNVVKIRFNLEKSKNFGKIPELFTKAFLKHHNSVTIELYNESQEEKNETADD